ncbi:hypothetical protein GCM10027269_07190 [Kribbella endophytica]
MISQYAGTPSTGGVGGKGGLDGKVTVPPGRSTATTDSIRAPAGAWTWTGAHVAAVGAAGAAELAGTSTDTGTTPAARIITSRFMTSIETRLSVVKQGRCVR